MAEVRQREMTVEEFLIWNLSQEERYEFVDGLPVPLRGMSGASDAHDAIVVDLIIALGSQLKGTGCRPSTADKAVRTTIRRVRRPDVTVECSGVDPKSYEARHPIAVFEVLSPSTRANDLNVKLNEYQRHPSLRTIVHIDPGNLDVLVYTRGANGLWDTERLERAEDRVLVPGTPVALPLAAIYDGVPLAAPDAVQPWPS